MKSQLKSILTHRVPAHTFIKLTLTIMLGTLLILGYLSRSMPADGFVTYSPGPLLSATIQVNGQDQTTPATYKFATIKAQTLTYAQLISYYLKRPKNTTVIHQNLDPTQMQSQFTLMDQTTKLAANLAQQVVNANYSIESVAPLSPASRAGLLPQDLIQSVNNKPFLVPTSLETFVRPDQPVKIAILRDSKPLTLTLTTLTPDKAEKLGIAISTSNNPNSITTKVTGAGGPSGGLLITIAAIDTYYSTTQNVQLAPRDTLIVATGTISKSGIVGPVGGVDQKIKAAGKAAVFFVPPAEYEQAVSAAPGNLKVVAVKTLQEALTYICANITQNPSSHPVCVRLNTVESKAATP